MRESTMKKIGEGTLVRHPELCNIYGPGKIGKNCKISAFVEIGPEVEIGDNCVIGAYTFIPEGVIVGNNVFIGPRVTFCNDKYPASRGSWRKLKKTRVMDDAVIGGCASILPGLYIGRNAFIGAAAVVTRDVEDNHIVAGNPAKVMRERRRIKDAD